VSGIAKSLFWGMFEGSRKDQNRSMGEVRLCWRSVPRIDGEVFECGPWQPEGARGKLMEILEAGNQVNGEGSHWIQERNVRLFPLSEADHARIRQ